MLIRVADIKDADRIARNSILLAREIEQMRLKYQNVLIGTETLIRNKEKGFYLVIEENNEIIGQVMITFEWSDWRNMAIWWIHRVYVQESWRGKGVFKKLFEEVKKMALKNNVFAIRLYVYRENKDAITTYENIGMEKPPFSIYQQILSH